MEEKVFEKLNLKDYQVKVSKEKVLTKNQRLALEIIEFFQIEKKWQGRWWRVAKLNTAFLEDKFLYCKTRNKPAPYLWRMLFPKKNV